MAGPLLDSKLMAPRLRGAIARRRLHERLARGAQSRLTLVSAPAGFGKTTLLAEWLAPGPGHSVAWVSLDRRDNDPGLFWSYVVTAISTAAGGAGAEALSVLRSTQTPVEPLLATVLNDLQLIPDDLFVVLDDYHLIEVSEIQDSVLFFLEHLPPHVHVIIAGRTDPPLPLARFRARGELVEIRAQELRFTPGEAATYLTDCMGLSLTPPDVAALEGRTEGWIAALQLAAISLQDRDDPSAFIAGFAGDDRYIVDYLLEEVLQGQPEGIQRFLLQTSILDRLTGPLVDAVTGQDNGSSTLRVLERGNLFLVPLDERRQWFRYHHLFADVLQARLLDERAGKVAELHLRASAWYEHNGWPHEAIDHAFAAKDLDRAADLIELAVPAIRRYRQEAVLQRWLPLLPRDVIRARPVLGLELVGALMLGGNFDGVHQRLRDIEPWSDPETNNAADPADSSTGLVVRDTGEFRKLPGMAEVYRAALALGRGDVAGTITQAEHALSLLPPDDHGGRAAAHGLLGLAFWRMADLPAAHDAYSACSDGLRSAGFIADTFGCAVALADIRLAQGRLNEATATYEQALDLALTEEGQTLRGAADMYVGLGSVHRECNDLQAAARFLKRSEDLGPGGGLPQNPYRSRVALAAVCEADGNLDGALALLTDAEHLYVSDFFPNVRPVPALKARILIRQGRLAEARNWAATHGVTPDDDLHYLREFEHITLARALLAESAGGDPASLHSALSLLDRLLDAARSGGRAGSVIEIRILQALALHQQGNPGAALTALTEATALAEPEGYVRIFADEGPPMASLLKAALKRSGTSPYLRRLLAAIESRQDITPATFGLVEPLSDREQDVLRLLGTDLSGPAIASELSVSLNTVRTHTSRIYAKLNVNNRRAAVRRARQLNLLP
ncbi:LuxR C-terminal-related transcriptional regulator [Arthrobacter sp. MPF02]|uniref:LuxR C-terminal-related transcriptional regulator n=1 Tax=Arthrobacter sp. MPF02 TaxID=3388492 RepID=UPI0039850BBD